LKKSGMRVTGRKREKYRRGLVGKTRSSSGPLVQCPKDAKGSFPRGRGRKHSNELPWETVTRPYERGQQMGRARDSPRNEPRGCTRKVSASSGKASCGMRSAARTRSCGKEKASRQTWENPYHYKNPNGKKKRTSRQPKKRSTSAGQKQMFGDHWAKNPRPGKSSAGSPPNSK